MNKNIHICISSVESISKIKTEIQLDPIKYFSFPIFLSIRFSFFLSVFSIHVRLNRFMSILVVTSNLVLLQKYFFTPISIHMSHLLPKALQVYTLSSHIGSQVDTQPNNQYNCWVSIFIYLSYM